MREEVIGNQRLILGDSREVLSSLVGVDVFMADPPYGVDGGRGGQARDGRGKAGYKASWDDTPDYISSVIVPIVMDCIKTVARGAVTPGSRCMFSYPKPDDIGCFWTPAAANVGPWGFTTFHPIFYYGKDFRAGKGPLPTGRQLTELAPKNGHPCPKPLLAWTWLLEKVALPTDTVLDPFMGSGTTLVACENTGRHGIGIEIEPKFFDISCREVEKATKQQRIEFEPAVDVSLFEVPT